MYSKARLPMVAVVIRKVCDFRMPFTFMGKKIPEKQLLRLFKRGSTINLKGFKDNGLTREGLLRFNNEMTLVFEAKKARDVKPKANPKKATEKQGSPSCPQCGAGKIVKGKTAYGCSNWKSGCDFRFSFDEVFKRAKGKKLTKELVWGILTG